MWFYWYWYQYVIIGLTTLTIMYYIKWDLLEGEDILLSIIAYFKGEK